MAVHHISEVLAELFRRYNIDPSRADPCNELPEILKEVEADPASALTRILEAYDEDGHFNRLRNQREKIDHQAMVRIVGEIAKLVDATELNTRLRRGIVAWYDEQIRANKRPVHRRGMLELVRALIVDWNGGPLTQGELF